MLSTTIRLAAALTSVMLLSAVPVAAQNYQYTSFGEIFAELESPLPQAILLPTCISDSGVLGFNGFVLSPFGQSSFLIDRTEWDRFSPSGINAVNASGATVGRTPSTGWLRQPDGTITTLTPPAGYRTITPRGISADGTIVGSTAGIVNGTLKTVGFVLDETGYSVIEYPGATRTELRGVNASGTMAGVGFLPAPLGTQAFLRERNGAFSLLEIPGSTSSQALGINNRGQIVGSFRSVLNRTFGFVHERGQTTVIDVSPEFVPSIVLTSGGVPKTYTLVAGSPVTSVVAVNTRGDILVDARAVYLAADGAGVSMITGFVGTASRGK